MRKVWAAVAVGSACLVAIPSVLAIDVNNDRLHDFYLREQPMYPYANVGANCDVWQYNSPVHARLYVRTPIVWGLPALGRQQVRWRARFYDVDTREVRATGAWVTAIVGPKQATTFGGGPDAGNGVMITHGQYWDGGQYYDHVDSQRIRAWIDAGWYSRRKGRWITRTLDVKWMIATSNRTIRQGQTGPYSTPVTNWTC